MPDPIAPDYKYLTEHDLKHLRIPEATVDEVNVELRIAYESGRQSATDLLNANPDRLNELSNWYNPGISRPAMDQRRSQFVNDAVNAAQLARPLDTQAGLTDWLTILRYPDAARGARNFASNYTENLRKGAENLLAEKLDNHRKVNFDDHLTDDIEDLNQVIRGRTPAPAPGAPTPAPGAPAATTDDCLANTAAWIASARRTCAKVAPDEVPKLDLKLTHAEQTDTSRSYEFVMRNLVMAGSTISALGLATHFFVTKGYVEGGLPAGITMAVNAGINLFLLCRHNARVEQLVTNSLKQAQEATSMPAVLLWTGVLTHVLDKFNPIIFFGRDKCKTLGDNTPESTVSATKDRLRDVAKTAITLMDPKPSKDSPSSHEWLHKDGKINDALRPVEINVNSLIGRWNTVPSLLNYLGVTSASLVALPAVNSLIHLFK